MADDQIEVSISATTAGFQSDMQNAARAAEDAFSDITQSAGDSAGQQDAAENDLAGKRQARGRKHRTDEQRLAQQQAASWKTAIAEVTSAESKFIDSVFKGRQSLTKSLEQLGTNLIESEIKNDAKALTTKLLNNALGLNSDKAAAQGGFLFHLIAENQKTGATVAGNTARVASTEQAAAESVVAEKTASVTTISSDAAKAAAGAYQSAAQIPFVGWIIAPIAAAAAFVAVEAFGSFAEGSWELPEDMLALVHKGEMIIPAAQATGLRSAVAGFPNDALGGGGGTGAGGGDNFSITIQAIDTQSGAQFLKNNMGVIVSGLQRQMRNGTRLQG